MVVSDVCFFVCPIKILYNTSQTQNTHDTKKHNPQKHEPSYSHEQIPISTKNKDRVIPVRTHSDEQTDNQ
jgi:hypothetical protein